MSKDQQRGTLYLDFGDILSANNWEAELGTLIGYSPNDAIYKDNSINILIFNLKQIKDERYVDTLDALRAAI